VSEFKEEKRLEELGGHELVSNNPFEVLDTNAQSENTTFTEKIKEGLHDTSSKICKSHEKIKCN